MPNKKLYPGLSAILILIVVAVVLSLGGYFLLADKSKNQQYSSQTAITNIPTVTTAPTSTSVVDISMWKTFEMKEVNISLKYPPTWIITQQPVNDTGKHLAKIKGNEGEINLTWAGREYGGGCPPENEELKTLLGEKQDVCHYKGRLSSNDENWYILTTTSKGEGIQFGVTVYKSGTDSTALAQKILESFVYTK